MRIVTFKANKKTIFGIILAITGLIVILLTFVGNHNGAVESGGKSKISCATTEQRKEYLTQLGWQTNGAEQVRNITIPKAFNDVYQEYNQIQKQQGFDLENYKGKTATIYTYNISNYKGNDNVIADLIIADGELIGADLCDTNADDGFLVALEKNGK